MLSFDEFPFRWTATLDTKLDASLSDDLVRSFLYDEETMESSLGTFNALASRLLRRRVLAPNFLALIPTLRSEDLEFERQGGAIRAVLRLTCDRFVVILLVIAALYFAALERQPLLGLLVLVVPSLRCLLVLEVWKWILRRETTELETVLATEGGLPGKRRDGESASEPAGRSDQGNAFATPLEIDDTGNWPRNDLDEHLRTLAGPGVARIVLADWDVAEESETAELLDQDEIDRWLVAQVDPVVARLVTRLGPSDVGPEGGAPNGSTTLVRREWRTPSGLVALELRSFGDGLHALHLEDSSNHVRI